MKQIKGRIENIFKEHEFYYTITHNGEAINEEFDRLADIVDYFGFPEDWTTLEEDTLVLVESEVVNLYEVVNKDEEYKGLKIKLHVLLDDYTIEEEGIDFTFTSWKELHKAVEQLEGKHKGKVTKEVIKNPEEENVDRIIRFTFNDPQLYNSTMLCTIEVTVYK